MTGVSACAHAWITIFGHFEDIVGIPNSIIRVVGLFGVIMDTDFDIVFFDELFCGIESFDGLGIDHDNPHGFGEFENFPRGRLVRRKTDYPIGDRGNSVFFALRFDLLPDFWRGIVTKLDVWLFFGKFLTGVEFDHLTSCVSGLFDGFKNAEVVEGVGLATNGEAPSFEVFGNGGGLGEAGQGCQTDSEEMRKSNHG